MASATMQSQPTAQDEGANPLAPVPVEMLPDVPHYPAPPHLELVGMPPPLHGNASHEPVRHQNVILRELVEALRGQVEHYYAQMKLMEMENGQLHQQAFAKQQGRAKCTEDREIDTTHGRHMTLEEMMDALAYIKFKQAWKDLLKEATQKFKVAADEREKEWRRKEDERIVKKAANETEKRVERELEKALHVMQREVKKAKIAAGKHPKGSQKGMRKEDSDDELSNEDLEAIREKLDTMIHSPLKKQSAPRPHLVKAPKPLKTVTDSFIDDHKLRQPQQNLSGGSQEAKKVIKPPTWRSTRRLANA
ncbi:hypothetical protein BS17DRAFT_859235 [Gyrodon lividus]|nr:hypothetical protein BS17DRAFT_859235 [Gyrodon lividus]